MIFGFWMARVCCTGRMTSYGRPFEDLARELEHTPIEIGKAFDMTRNLNHIYFWKDHPSKNELLNLCSSVEEFMRTCEQCAIANIEKIL